MSIDTRYSPNQPEHPDLLGKWETRSVQIRQTADRRTADRRTASKVFGKAAKTGAVYRWGLAAANSAVCDPTTIAISRLAVGARLGKKLRNEIDLVAEAESLIDRLNKINAVSATDAAYSIIWAAALPGLADELDPDLCTQLFETLLRLRESVLQRSQPSSVGQLMIGAELGLVLAWRCAGRAGTSGLRSSSIKALSLWCDQQQQSLSASLERPAETRLLLASLLRCKHLIQTTTKRRFTRQAKQLAERLATWVAALTVHSGSTAFSCATHRQVEDDLRADGLLAVAAQSDPETLPSAFAAALGKTHAGGRLAWQVMLPDAMHHDPDAKVAVMFPDWDVRRGRTHIQYSGDQVNLEIFAGRCQVIAGTWQTMIETAETEQLPRGCWNEICEYSDDDVHYLELEQPWTGGLLLQRQLMLVRDDRCLLLADSIIPEDQQQGPLQSIKYHCRLPLAPALRLIPEPETRDAFIADKHKQALVIPLSANEWKIGPTAAKIQQSPDGCLVFSSTGSGRLFAPIWLDFQRRRFKRKRTWRQLTVADQLRLVGRDEAVGYRVQVGSEQWAVYRSLANRVCRSFLGKHLIADFFASRFDPQDGGHEALVTVDDTEHDE